MRIAIPLANGRLALHFGHCEKFALIDTDPENRNVLHKDEIEPPAHEPGLLPRWLAEKGATVIIAGGMGQRAQNLFTENGIEVLVGVSADSPEEIVKKFLLGALQTGENACDH